MAYEVTATRRRPQDFDSLVGQEFVAATLKNAIERGNIAHAYLFSGPRGCGKTSSARILAKALNCLEGPTATPCGKCTNCQEITRGASLDVIEIDGASNTSVNDIRQIKDEVLFPPNSCRYKIYIIDEVHMLSTSAFNALLKTIEEPPPYVIFIFATTELHKVPATIKSRCQQFNFRLVSVEQLKELLAEAAKEINITADEEALYWIAKEATGSVRDAYTLFDQVVSFSGDHITYDKIRDTLGLVGLDLLNTLTEACAEGKSDEALEELDTIFQNGASIEQFIVNYADYFRSLLLIKSGVIKEALLGQSVERFSSKVLEQWSAPQLERGLSLLLGLYRDIRYSLSPRYEVDLAISRLCGLSHFVSMQDVHRVLERTGALLGGSNPFVEGGAVPPEHRQLSKENFTTKFIPPAPATKKSGTALNSAPYGGPASLGVSSSYSTGVESPYSALDRTSSHFTSEPLTTKRDFSAGESVPLGKDETSKPYSAGVGNVDLPRQNVNNKPAEKSATFFGGSFQKLGGESPVETRGIQTAKRFSLDSVDMAQFKQAVLEELSLKHTSTASALVESLPWEISENHIRVTVPNLFSLNQLQKEKLVVTQTMAALVGQDVVFEPQLKQEVSESKQKKQVPQQIDILCKVFKGSVIGVSKR